jgi:chemotaxis protein histidine kinase CheA/CheY-like chemotaxis protein
VVDVAVVDVSVVAAPMAVASAAPVAVAAPASGAPAPSADSETGTARGGASLHIPVELLDELLRVSGETIVLAHQIEQRLGGVGGACRDIDLQVRTAKELLVSLDDQVALRGAALQTTSLRDSHDVDPLELDQYNELHVVSRHLIETNTDERELVARLDNDLIQLDELLAQQTRMQQLLQRLVLRTRRVAFGTIAARLQRIVRQTARQLDKQVELRILGEDTEIDSQLLDQIVEPLGQALRNAVDHGIEPIGVRVEAGKPELGLIELRVAQTADLVAIDISDDGRGLDLRAILSKAERQGLVETDVILDDDAAARLVLLPGFSTREATSQVSGRGVGMDVVNQRVLALRGNLALHSRSGAGLTVALRLPSNQMAANVIIARSGEQTLAVVSASVAQVVSLPAEAIRHGADGGIEVLIDEQPLPLLPLEALFGRDDMAPSAPQQMPVGLLVVDAQGQRSVVGARRIDEVRNVIIKPISRYAGAIPAVRGMTVLGDGGVAPVVDLAALLHARSHATCGWAYPALATVGSQSQRIVVADDSLSVRRALVQLMQDAGYTVAEARDGMEALNAINEEPPIAVLLDLEMPRLNGLEVTRFMRNQVHTRAVPVIMITSRASDKYRTAALEAGVTHMLGKPFDEDDLVRLVRASVQTAERTGTSEAPALAVGV